MYHLLFFTTLFATPGDSMRAPIKSLFMICLMALLYGSPVSAAGEPYHPTAVVHVVSEYSEQGSTPPGHVQWLIRAQDGNHEWTLGFSPAGSRQPLCRVTLTREQGSWKVLWMGPGKTKAFSGIMVLPGFPAPCDILPWVTEDSTSTYRVKQEAGGHGFVTTYRVVREQVSLQNATERGWIRSRKEIQPPLYRLKVMDSSGATVVMQLWDSDGSWWIYEQSGSRRSWAVDTGE